MYILSNVFVPSFLLILVFSLAFSALLLRGRDAKRTKAVLAVSYAVLGLWSIDFVGGFIAGLHAVLFNYIGTGFGIALVCTLTVAVFWFLAHRKKDRLVAITAAVLAVLLACNTVVWGIAQFCDFGAPPPINDDTDPGYGENKPDNLLPGDDSGFDDGSDTEDGSMSGDDDVTDESTSSNNVYMLYKDAEEAGTCYLSFVNTYTEIDVLTVPSVSPSGKRVVGIDSWVFSGEEIKDFVLPDTLEWIGYNAFDNTPFHENEQNWENGCLYIGEYLVACREPMAGETALTVKDGTRLIADATIRGDWKEVIIPESVEHIGARPFESRLETITVAPENPVYCSVTGCLIERESGTLVAAANGAVIPNDGSVRHIGAWAFEYRQGASVTLPDGLLTIGEFAFYECDFADFSSRFPDSLEEIGSHAFWFAYVQKDWGEELILEIPAATRKIGTNALYIRNLDGIRVAEGNPVYHSAGDCLIETASGTLLRGGSNSVIPSDGSIRKIQDYAFRYYEIDHVVIPEGVTHIGYQAFGNSYMTTLSLPSTLQEIDAYAFSDCYYLTEVVIPSSVTKIGYFAFADCDNLNKVTFSEGLEELGGQAFAYCDGLVSVHLPRSLRKIGTEEWTEGNMTHSGVMGGFVGCKSLVSLTVDAQNPVYYSTGNCIIERASVKVVTAACGAVIPNDGSVKCIGKSAFEQTYATVIAVPEGVTTIENYAFAYSDTLCELYIPKTVTEIGYYICHTYEQPVTIYYGGTVAEWQALMAQGNSVDDGVIVRCADGIVPSEE